MVLDRERLKDVLDKMGYDVEFDSDTPGLVVGNSITDWNNVPLGTDSLELTLDKKIKTKNLFLKGKNNLMENFAINPKNTKYKTDFKSVGTYTSVKGLAA